jgi:myo-inositol-1(or 4)-monophosphatase
MREDLKRWLSLAEEAARLSGAFLVKFKDKAKKIRSNFGRDIKVEADQESEKIIADYLQGRSEFPILSEESGLQGTANSDRGFLWIIDPLDGSLNYSRGIPICCISIGLWQGDNPVLGSVYDFNNEELFAGIVGEGAWLNQKSIKPSTTAKEEQAILFTGFPIGTDFSVNGLTAFVRHIQAYKKLRLLGSAALSLAYVASGRADAYLEKDIMLWDVAGGLAIVKAAGGRIIQINPHKLNTLTVYASNPMLPEPKLE